MRLIAGGNSFGYGSRRRTGQPHCHPARKGRGGNTPPPARRVALCRDGVMGLGIGAGRGNPTTPHKGGRGRHPPPPNTHAPWPLAAAPVGGGELLAGLDVPDHGAAAFLNDLPGVSSLRRPKKRLLVGKRVRDNTPPHLSTRMEWRYMGGGDLGPGGKLLSGKSLKKKAAGLDPPGWSGSKGFLRLSP